MAEERVRVWNRIADAVGGLQQVAVRGGRRPPLFGLRLGRRSRSPGFMMTRGGRGRTPCAPDKVGNSQRRRGRAGALQVLDLHVSFGGLAALPSFQRHASVSFASPAAAVLLQCSDTPTHPQDTSPFHLFLELW